MPLVRPKLDGDEPTRGLGLVFAVAHSDGSLMSRELYSISATPIQRTPLPVSGSGEAPSPILRGGSVVPFAVRNELRGPSSFSWLPYLRKGAGIALTATAWLIFLYGMASLILAALHNQQGELGLGLESTLTGAKSCFGAFILAAIGLPQWVTKQRQPDRK